MRACSERWLASQPAVGAAPPLVFARRMKATVLNRPDPSWLFARSRSQGIALGFGASAFATTSPTTAEPSSSFHVGSPQAL